MRHVVSVRNHSDLSLSRAGNTFEPKSVKTVRVTNVGLAELKACRYLSVHEVENHDVGGDGHSDGEDPNQSHTDNGEGSDEGSGEGSNEGSGDGDGSGDGSGEGEDAGEGEDMTCPHCDHPPFATVSGRNSHIRSKHSDA